METVTPEKVIEGEHESCSTLCEKGNRKRERYGDRERKRERKRERERERERERGENI